MAKYGTDNLRNIILKILVFLNIQKQNGQFRSK